MDDIWQTYDIYVRRSDSIYDLSNVVRGTVFIIFDGFQHAFTPSKNSSV